MVLGTGFWIYAVVTVMLLAGLMLLRSVFVSAPVQFGQRDVFLNDVERRLYQALQVWSGDRWLIFAKVPLIDVVSPRGAGKSQRTWLDSLAQNRVDFLLCDPMSTRVVAAVLIQHQGETPNADRLSAPQQFALDVLRQGGVRTVMIPAQSRYSADEIQQYIGS